MDEVHNLNKIKLVLPIVKIKQTKNGGDNGRKEENKRNYKGN